MKEFIRVENLNRDYQMSTGEEKQHLIPVLKQLNFQVEEQEFTGIMGKSGCGKTTLLKVLGLIDRATDGSVYFKGKDVKKMREDERADIRRREIGFVFQDFYLMDNLTVEENIMLPMIIDKAKMEKCSENARKYEEFFGIRHLVKKNPYELSGGEKQKTAICRALVNDPDLILADEPTGNLDSGAGDSVVEILTDINEQMGKTVIMVTHDPKVASHCKRILFLKDGKIVKDLKRTGKKEEFYRQILAQMEYL